MLHGQRGSWRMIPPPGLAAGRRLHEERMPTQHRLLELDLTYNRPLFLLGHAISVLF